MQIRTGGAENTGKTGRAAEIPVLTAGGVKLKDGDIIIASVERIEGDSLQLRLDDGSVLNASLRGELTLAPGQTIEVRVEGRGDAWLLHLLSTSGDGALPGEEGQIQTIPLPVLTGMLSILKRNPGLPIDTARFLAETGIADTAENMAVLSRPVENGGVGAVLGAILKCLTQPDNDASPNTMSPALTQAETPADAYVSGAGTGLSAGGSAQTAVQGEAPGVSPDMPKAADTAVLHFAPAGVTAESVNGEAAAVPPDMREAGWIPAEQLGNNAQYTSLPIEHPTALNARTTSADVRLEEPPVNAPESAIRENESAYNGAVKQAVSPPENAAQQVRYDDNAEVTARGQSAGAVPQTRMDETAAVFPERKLAEGTQPDEAHNALPEGTQGEISSRIDKLVQGMLVHPETLDGGRLKKAAQELPDALKTLKSSLDQSDIRNKESFLKGTDQLMRQLEMADRDVRFTYMQLPLQGKDGNCQTAELYVFRRQNKRQEQDGTGISILVALDTAHLGRIESLIRETGGSISLEFRLEETGAADLFKRNVESLKQTLEGAGYRLADMRFAGLEKKTTVLNAGETILPGAGRTRQQGIDVMI